ncbi:GNAT family N-acetyltransferase [Clostridium frigidicarnis]|uniref:Ribosomal protein S18 acetylase RimI n=1 Tax=Clostridium frigidicarnis TaxID=84698 RepID=A0A1I0X2K9_9CLOT|nr:GNAT family N-acetyltransferase [Clostridium frigidicarnis]SFA95249.1 Ribosomal protein S18 acetylase RimI [Clostridium frigidicarnis]
MIRKATYSDLDNIMEIIKETVEEMKSYNNNQWDESYPKVEDFILDIENEELYVHDSKGEIQGFVCVNYIEPVEYKDLEWSSEKNFMVIHRMAVSKKVRNKGIGKKLMEFAERLSQSNNINFLKTDTNSVNIKMNSLFKKCGFNFVGEIKFLGKESPFYCYEKLF